MMETKRGKRTTNQNLIKKSREKEQLLLNMPACRRKKY
jgi:hypothetical protein